jgi:opacity protein-like surface antigen
MIRTFALAAVLAAGLAAPVLAADADTGPAMQNLFTQDQARQHLMHMGYTNISGLEKDADGKWIGYVAALVMLRI